MKIQARVLNVRNYRNMGILEKKYWNKQEISSEA